MPNAVPTKGNLIAAKRSLILAKLGYELMDRKRNILVREMMSMIGRAKEMQSEIDATFSAAYSALQQANIMTGTCNEIALATPVDESVSIGYRSVIGVEIPIVTRLETVPDLSYGLFDTASSLDRALERFHKVKRLTAMLAEVETSVYRLAFAVKKTQKRANALKNIIIPRYTDTISFITGVLEERDREEFSRLKVIKAAKMKEQAKAGHP